MQNFDIVVNNRMNIKLTKLANIKLTNQLFVTRYEKRDRSGYFIDSLFLVWIVSAISVESNGASFVKKEAS